MRFVVDARLPETLVDHLPQLGHDAIQVKHLPRGGDTSDSEITRFADAEGRVVVTKDSDSRHTHETGGHPSRLLLISWDALDVHRICGSCRAAVLTGGAGRTAMTGLTSTPRRSER